VALPEAILAGVAAVAAVANWWSRVADHRPTELWSKPAALAALVGVALTVDATDPTVRAWFVVGLVLSLLGDVLLLDDRRFVAGLAAFLLGHVAYVVGFLAAEPWRWWGAGLGLAVAVVLVAVVGRRIVAGARGEDARLGTAVTVYLLVISTMAVTAAGAGNGWAIVGAGLFVASDAILGWRKFVGEKPWMGPAVMVTYHLGQAGLVASLV
jgi:uncharacterized membrane protein YhhN